MYLYKTKREKHIEKPRIKAPPKQPKPNEDAAGVGLSDIERRAYRAMRKAGWAADDIRSQVNVHGGRSKLGGQVVDFLIVSIRLPIMVNGEYWHRNGDEQLQAEAAIMEEFGKPPVVLWGDELEDDEQALATVIRKIGRAGGA